MPSPELTVDLIRHAESMMNVRMADPNVVPFIGGRENHVDLSEAGELQARKLGVYAVEHGIKPARIFCSPAVRSRRTHQLSAEVMGLCVDAVVDDRLQELDQGTWTNQPRALYEEPANKKEMSRLAGRFTPPEGESMDEVADRMHDFMSSLEPESDTEHLWVHTHGVAIKAWVGKLHRWSHERTYTTPVHNASITRVTRLDHAWRLMFFNRRTN